MMHIEQVIQVVYIFSAACFILALNWLSAVPTAPGWPRGRCYFYSG